ncbi:PAS domain-containing sensor histidine kinase [Cupriavidus taiwanensis]|uniref:Sensory/regulatory protein RpfC n=1 Tax=Cupriavidus taiwanensis TaxID=164546 RepID=A0A7Z7JFL9_9BURK|nr:PAS domain-containing sensor histidine kinase [Cupriavidus taiwanensis]SOZ10282.1 putative sensor hybrid histidine kinase [Cupriavidus taiwanensis]SOZ43757.1 putative sensor hybrid histidine kinase [Cupriavidus taiwanensis]SPC22999.1 putative sensor hybrid histidine kinase [Cupriavidus taiwanensis]SPD54508.1 putative sensor hybrid histidine kinase [Cupriavidus taiwanensis]
MALAIGLSHGAVTAALAATVPVSAQTPAPDTHAHLLGWCTVVLCAVTPCLLAWIIALYREVRRRRAAETALQDCVAIQTALLDGIPQPVYLRDAALRLVACNRSYEELLGATRGSLLGQPLDAVLSAHPLATDMAELARDYRQVIADGAPLHADRCLRLGDRTLHVLNWLTPLRGADGTVKGLAGGCVDLTERHEMLAELAQAKTEAEAANRAKSAFLASVSHEIRTPMNAITGMLELTLAQSLLPDEQRLQLLTAHKSAVGLLALIDDILDLSKLEAGKFRIHPAPTSLPGLVDDTLLIFGPGAAQKGLPLTSGVSAALAPLHQVDALRFRQILANLASNAVRFTDSGTVHVRLDAQSTGDGIQDVILTVSDTGVGIPFEAQARLFQPFEQVHGCARSHAGGTGLGLAICRRLAKAMGGRITLTSQPGRGTRVVVSLPLAIASAAQPAEPAPPPPMSGCPRRAASILVIDDHAPNRLLLHRQLEHLGHRVTTACDGREGLAALDRASFDVIVCDCAMPVMDGLAFTRAVRARRDAHRRVPIIGCTASAVAGDHVAAMAAGMNAVVVKPVGLQALDAAVSQACAGRHQPSGVHPPEPPGHARGQAMAQSPGTVGGDSTGCHAAPGAHASWCAICRAMNVQCDRIEPPED